MLLGHHAVYVAVDGDQAEVYVGRFEDNVHLPNIPYAFGYQKVAS